jgi:predicted membrane protein
MDLFNELEGFVTGKLSVIKTMLSIVKLETKLAGLSIFPLIVNICMLLIGISSTWTLFMVLFCYGILYLFNSMLIALTTTLILNMAIIFGLIKYLMFNLKSMSFEKTRAFISREASNNYDKQKETTISPTRDDGPKLTLPTE